MKDIKEEIVDSLLTTLVEFEREKLETIRQALSTILHCYTIAPDTTLPSINVDDTQKIIKRFLATKRLEGCLPNTLRHYRYVVTKFADDMNTNLCKVDTNTIRVYLATITERGAQNVYIDNIRLVLNSFYQFMEDEDLIPKNPCRKIKRIKSEQKMEEPFSDEEIIRLQDACVTEKEIALIDILMSTGCRREEITKIMLTDINWDRKSITIHGKGAKDRVVYFNARCKIHLNSYLEKRPYESPYLFASDRAPHGQLSVESMHVYVKRIGQRANVQDVHLHRFRKWFATSMTNKGMDIRDLKELMGHEKIETTNNYYIFANAEHIKAEHKRFTAA